MSPSYYDENTIYEEYDDADTILADMTAKQEAVAADAATVASDKGLVAADKATVIANADTVATNMATVAADKATVASDKASVAADRMTVAGDKATVAADKATVAADKATVLGYKTDAETAADTATNAANSAAAFFDMFDDRYLGSKTSDPTLDNDGNALVEGQLYWNSVSNALKVYDGAAWQSYNPLAGAPGDVDYLVKTSNGLLSAERVITDTASAVWDWSTAGQAKVNVQFGTSAGTAAQGNDSRITGAAPLASPTFTGTPAAPTAAVDTNTTQIATTAFLIAQAAAANPVMDGTAAPGSSTRFARADHVHPTDTSRAALASPTFTGTPAAPTAAVDTNTTQIATTAFLIAQAAAATPVMDGTGAAGTSTRFARADHVHPSDTSRAPLASPTFTGTPAAPTAAQDTSTTQLATTAYAVAQDKIVPGVRTYTGTTDTLVIGDAGGFVEGNNASSNTCTIPPNSSVAFPVKTYVNFAQIGAGLMTIVAGAGVTLRSRNGLKLGGQFACASAYQRAANEWVLSGDLST